MDKLEEITFDNFKELPFLIATFNEVSISPPLDSFRAHDVLHVGLATPSFSSKGF